MNLLNGVLDGVIGVLPNHLSCFGAGEDEINKPFTQTDTPPFIYPAGESPFGTTPTQSFINPSADQQPVDMAPLKATMEFPITSYLSPAGAQANLPEVTKSVGVTAPAAPSATGAPQIAVQPSTETQIFNLVNVVAKGLLAVQQTNAQAKLSTAQIAALAEASKVQAQNYVMQQLQQGKQVMVPQSWLEKYSTSDTLTKWLTPILILGGLGLLGYAAYKYSQQRKGGTASKAESLSTIQGAGSVPSSSLSEADASMAAANPRGRRRNGKIWQEASEVKALAEKVIAEQPDDAFGHGYLWGVVRDASSKSRPLRTVGRKMLISGIPGKQNHWKIEEEVRKHPAVSMTWINLD
jgi:hypothetical protein